MYNRSMPHSLYSEDMSFSAEHPFRLYERETAAGSRAVAPHFHPSVEIVVFLNGAGTVIIDGTPHRYRPNMLIASRPYALHEYRFASERQKHIILRIDPRIVGDIVRGSHIERTAEGFLSRFYSLVPVQPVPAGSIAALRSMDGSTPLSRLGALFASDAFFSQLCTVPQRAYPFDHAAAMSYIEEHYAEKVTLTDIAAHLGESTSKLSRSFSAAYPSGFSDFLARVRIAKAKGLITHTDNPLSAVAYAVGFSDVPQFTKTFRRYTGSTPRDYRKRLQ